MQDKIQYKDKFYLDLKQSFCDHPLRLSKLWGRKGQFVEYQNLANEYKLDQNNTLKQIKKPFNFQLWAQLDRSNSISSAQIQDQQYQQQTPQSVTQWFNKVEQEINDMASSGIQADPEKTEKFKVILAANIGYIEGILTLTPNLLIFEPDVQLFNTNYQPENKQDQQCFNILNYQMNIDLRDIFTFSISQQNYDVYANTYDVFLRLFLEEVEGQRSPIVDQYGNMYVLKIEFKSIDHYQGISQDSSDIGKTYIDYIAKKLLFNIMKLPKLEKNYITSSSVYMYEKVNIKSLSNHIHKKSRSKKQNENQIILPQILDESRIFPKNSDKQNQEQEMNCSQIDQGNKEQNQAVNLLCNHKNNDENQYLNQQSQNIFLKSKINNDSIIVNSYIKNTGIQQQENGQKMDLSLYSFKDDSICGDDKENLQQQYYKCQDLDMQKYQNLYGERQNEDINTDNGKMFKINNQKQFNNSMIKTDSQINQNSEIKPSNQDYGRNQMTRKNQIYSQSNQINSKQVQLKNNLAQDLQAQNIELRIKNHELIQQYLKSNSQQFLDQEQKDNKIIEQYIKDLIDQQQQQQNNNFQLTEEGKEIFRDLVQAIPSIYMHNDWYLVYSPNRNGYSYTEFIRKNQNLGPHIILIKDTNNIIFGAYVGEGWKLNKKTYGSAETFLFTFKKGEIMQWGWKGDEEDQNYQFCDKEGIYVGISNGVGLYIKNDFYLGSSNICSTFNNEPLTKTEYFHIKEIELWSFDNSYKIQNDQNQDHI